MEDKVNFLTFKALQKYDLTHFVTTICGGVSNGNYSTFNLSLYSGDEIDAVAENRERLADTLGILEEDILVPYQTHEDKILLIDEAFLEKSDLEKVKLLNGVDALITNQKNICIGVTTADCVPVLLYDPVRNIFSAVHAGWKGTVLRIVEKVIDTMVYTFECSPSDIKAGIGPCISQPHFEVGKEVVQAFVEAGFPMEKIGVRNSNSGKMHIDLSLANKYSLIEKGVLPEHIETSNLCTFANPDKFFSARRQTIHSGRMLSGGFLK
ncbi:peptidoglycan editing factor PgeF [Dysgonomonas sp. Marseille-P4361]|uniref:peptidoglycan editing factor PgeF n=1 Tax=Dysgonomonas sp. Marseille-P4361 TaxID=2161820 RepID=UPI000D55F86C|nr:peptidoglycan editing factor PgeF [Dysgonomonas sp. Marseille-P4361]